MHTIQATIFNKKYDLQVEYERNENGNILKTQLEILEMFISYVLYDYLNTSNLLAIRDPNYFKPKSQMDLLKDEMDNNNLDGYIPGKVVVYLPRSKNRVELVFKNETNEFTAVFENNQFKEVI